MSFNPEMLRSRLAASTEAADSITSTAHWILFHKRHASTVAEQWAEAIVSDKNTLSEIYIANEVIQQSKIKRKNEFVEAFAKVLPRALSAAYTKSDLPTRDRITRVVRVWRDRTVFSPSEQEAIEQAIKTAGESLNSSVPEDLIALVKQYQALQAASKTPQGASPSLVDQIKAELDIIAKKVDNLATQRAQIKSPEIEPLPSQAAKPAVEVYTASNAKESIQKENQRNANDDQNDDDDDIGYADSDEGENEQTTTPPEKKQKVEVDPKLASFLASLSGNNK